LLQHINGFSLQHRFPCCIRHNLWHAHLRYNANFHHTISANYKLFLSISCQPSIAEKNKVQGDQKVSVHLMITVQKRAKIF
jgi:hypothetical protein